MEDETTTDEVEEPAVEPEPTEDEDFAEFLAESGARIERENEVVATQEAVDQRAGEELIEFNIAEIARRGAWQELPLGMIDRLDAEQFEQFIGWRAMQPAEDWEDEGDAYEPYSGSYADPVTEDAARAFLSMSDTEFQAHLRGLSEGVAS